MILTTCSAIRDYDRRLSPEAYRGVLPTYTELVASVPLAVIEAVRCALEMGKRQNGHFLSPTYTPSNEAWDAGADGARCELHWQTVEAGFHLWWTFEIVVPGRVLTAMKVDDLVEVYEADRIDQPVASAVLTDGGPDRALRSLGFERVSYWTGNGAIVVAATVEAGR